MSCKSCGCSPCQCAPAALANPIISGGVFNGPVINGPTINGGTINDANLIAVHLDLASTGETSAPNVCDDRIATNAYVCTAIANAISSLNPAFCAAITACLLADSTALCPAVSICIATTPGIINTTGAFGFNARATTALHGVVRYATKLELEQANCLLAIDPCTLISEWNSPNLASPFWLSFANAVNLALGASPSFCASVFACGAAPLNNPIFTGNPRAPTPPPGDNDTSIATTAFVQSTAAAAVAAAIAPTGSFCAAIDACLAVPSAAFCAAVTACGGGGTSGVFAVGSATNGWAGLVPFPPFVANGCTLSLLNAIPLGVRITFTAPQPDTSYVVVASVGGGGAVNDGYVEMNKTVNSVDVQFTNVLDSAGAGLYFHVAR